MDILAYIDRIEDLYGNVLPRRKPPRPIADQYQDYKQVQEYFEPRTQMYIEREMGFDEGGRVNFANGSEAKKIDAYTQAKTDFKGKVWDTVEEAVESNKKIMKKWDPKVVKETIVEKRLRKYGKTDKKPYIPAEKLEATIVEEFQKKFPDKKIKLSIKDATYSDGRKRVDSPEFKKFKEEFMSNRFVKGEEDILKAYASARKRLGFVKKGQGPGHWQVLEELKKKGKTGLNAPRIKEILKINNLPTRPLPGNLRQAIKNSFNELVDAGTEIVDSKAVYDNLPEEFKGTKTSQPDIYKIRTQGELGLKGYIRDTLKNEEGFTRSTRAFGPEAIEKRAASIKALGKGKAPTEYQLAKKAYFKDLDPWRIKPLIRNIRPDDAAQLHHSMAKAYGEDMANLMFTSKALNDFDPAERALFRLASEKDRLVREKPPGFEKRIKQIESIENRIVKGKSIVGVELPAVEGAPGGKSGPGPQNVKNSFTVNEGYAEDIVKSIKGTPGEEITEGVKTKYRKGRKGLLGYREIDLEKIKDIDPSQKIVLGEGRMKGVDLSKTVGGLKDDPRLKKGFHTVADKGEAKNIVRLLNRAGIKCTLQGGLTCNDPRAYIKSINELKAKAAVGDKVALGKFRKVANGMRKLKGAAAWTGWGILGEIGFALPFAAMDYADGQSTARIINNASFGLFGMDEKEETISYLPKGSLGAEQMAAMETGERLTRLEEGPQPRGRIGMDPKRFQTAQQKTKEEAYLDFLNKITPFMEGPRNEYFNQEAFNKATQEVGAAQAKLAADIAKRKEKRRDQIWSSHKEGELTGLESYNIGFANGGLASLTRTTPPTRGPQYRGLDYLKYYGR